MKIGLFDVDQKYPNLALMKISAWHKSQGDEVFLNWEFENYDKVYTSCVFTKNKFRVDQLPFDNVIAGGTGIDLTIVLPRHIEFMRPDYDLYGIDYGLGFITRGCPRKCGFCVVPEKEGGIEYWQHPEQFVNDKSNKMVFLDNNFLAWYGHVKMLEEFVDLKWKIDFNQGLDIRLVNESNAYWLKQQHWLRRMSFAFDDIRYEKAFRKGMKILKKADIALSTIMIYMIVGYNSTFEEDWERYQIIMGFKVSPFIMVYGKPSRKVKKFASWVDTRLDKKMTFDKFLELRI